MTKHTDILTRLSIAPAAQAPRTRVVKRWRVSACGRWSRRFYPHAMARKIVTRLQRRGVDAFIDSAMIREVA